MTLSSQVLRNSKHGGFTDVPGGLSQCWTFILIESFPDVQPESPKSKLVMICLCQIICCTQKVFDWRQASELSVHHSCEKDQQLQCLWNRAGNSHYFYCIQDLVLYPETLSRSELIPTALCLLGLREEPVGDVMQRNWTKKRSNWLNLYLCKFFPCQFRQMLLTIHSIMLSTH